MTCLCGEELHALHTTICLACWPITDWKLHSEPWQQNIDPQRLPMQNKTKQIICYEHKRFRFMIIIYVHLPVWRVFHDWLSSNSTGFVFQMGHQGKPNKKQSRSPDLIIYLSISIRTVQYVLTLDPTLFKLTWEEKMPTSFWLNLLLEQSACIINSITLYAGFYLIFMRRGLQGLRLECACWVWKALVRHQWLNLEICICSLGQCRYFINAVHLNLWCGLHHSWYRL